MASKSKIVLAALVGASIGGAAIHGLHAQAKPKAYTITELETLDSKAAADIAVRIAKTQEGAGGRNRRRRSVSPLQSGITLTKHRHSSSRRNGPIWGPSVIRRSRPYADTR
jgi:hypothetical protein